MGSPFQTVPSQTTAFAKLDYSTSLRLTGTLAWEFATSVYCDTVCGGDLEYL
jgi:hypothetical protein